MPQFATELLPLNWVSKYAQQKLGNHFHVTVAVPGDNNLARGLDFPAVFYPDDDTTWIGSGVDAAFGGVKNLPTKELVYFSLRDFCHTHHDQIDIAIEADAIQVTRDLPVNWIKFGYSALLEVVSAQPDLKGCFYSSMPSVATLIKLPHKSCYHYPTTSVKAHLATRPKRRAP